MSNRKEIFVWRTTDGLEDPDSRLHYYVDPKVPGYESGLLTPNNLAGVVGKIKEIDPDYKLVLDENPTGPQPHKLTDENKEPLSEFL